MGDVMLDPYFYFKGNAREAMEFYQSVFGGELSVQVYGDTPDAVPGGVTEENKDTVMHARLEGGAAKLMASDSQNASDVATKIELSLSGDDDAQLRELFDKLSAGGKVNSPLEKMFWGDTFGNLTDKYGVTWMVNINAPK
jgi:PhnB protein